MCPSRVQVMNLGSLIFMNVLHIDFQWATLHISKKTNSNLCASIDMARPRPFTVKFLLGEDRKGGSDTIQ